VIRQRGAKLSGGISEADLSRARRDTPGCEEVLHFNNAVASLMPRPVLDATVSHLRLEARIGGYEAAGRSRESIERVVDASAALIGCDRGEIAVVENATRAWDMAFYSIPFGPGDRILTATAEYASNYIAFLQVARKTGAKVEPVPNDERGQLSVAPPSSTLLDTRDRNLGPLVRASVHYYNTEEEVSRFCETLERIL
jgi:cysteine desulfurase/selenocysteine lyase